MKRPRFPSLVLPLFALAGLVWLALSGTWPDGYMARFGTGPQPYPLKGVLIACAAVLIETALVAAVLRPASYTQSWGRAFVALVPAAGWWVVLAMGAMHQPPYFQVHLQWLALLVCGLALLCLVSLIRRLLRPRAGAGTR